MFNKLLKSILLFCTFTGPVLSAQNLDSLNSIISSNQSDSVKINTYIELSEYFKDSLPNKSIQYLETANTLAKKTKSNFLQARVTSELGHIMFFMSDYDKAISYFLTSSNFYKLTTKPDGLANCLNNLGSVYIELGDYKKGLQYTQNALSIYEDNFKKGQISQNQIAMANGNIGRCYYYLNDFANAKKHYNISLDISKKTGNEKRIALMLNNIGSVFAEETQYDSAIQYFNKCYDLEIKLGNKQMMVMVINNIAELHHKKGNQQQAILDYKKGLELAKEISYLDAMKTSYQGLHSIYLELKDYKNAHDNLEQYITIKDSIFNESNSETIAEMLTKFDSEKKEQEIELLNKEKVIQKFWKNTLIFGVFGLVVIAFLLFTKNKATQKSKRIIELQKDVIEEKQKEIVDSINYAKRIQKALISSTELIDNNFKDNFVFFQPKDIVSGDFYWTTEHNDRLYIAVCDSTGHGVPGAFMSLLNIGFLSEAIKEKNILEPNKIFDYVRNRLINSISRENQKDGMDGILICLDKKSYQLTYAAANIEPIIIRNQKVIELEKDRMPVGKGEKNLPFTLFTIEKEVNDSLYLYTDGFADQFGGPKGKKFKYKQLNETLQEISPKPFKEQSNTLSSIFENWKGNLEQVDDVCVIGIQI